MARRRSIAKARWHRYLAWPAGSLLLLQVFFVLRIAALQPLNPGSTTFQRTQAWHIKPGLTDHSWHQQWVPYKQIAVHLKRAVIVSEDDSFTRHQGVDWSALETAWSKNERAKLRAEKEAARLSNQAQNSQQANLRLVGGSTISQQLVKNLFLSPERTLLRKGQEMMLTLALEALLSKQRILEIYLNSVEWGEGIFGAEAAAHHYFQKPAAQIDADQAARLAVMLPRPKYFQKNPHSAYLSERAGVIAERMGRAVLP